MRLCISLIFLIVVFRMNGQEKKLLFIGIDGCRHDAIETSSSPNLDELISSGRHSTDVLTLYPTWSGNGWSTMLTGVKHNKHNVTNNDFTLPNYDEYPDFISRLEAFDPSLETYSVVHWSPINDVIQQDTDNEINVATDLEVKNQAVQILQENDPDILFLDFDDVDHAGHTYGFDPLVPEYLNSIEITDLYIGQIIDALEARPSYADEDWLIMVTTDHGGNAAGHGLGSFEERNSFITCYNENISAEQISATQIYGAENITTTHFTPGTYATPEDNDAFDFGAAQDFTVEMWVRTDVGFTGDPTFISNKDWNSGYNPGFVISGQSGQFWKVNIADGTIRADIQGGYINDQWSHIAVSFDRDGLMKAYEDGALIGLADISGIGDIDAGLPLVINQDGTTTYEYDFDGYYRKIRVWDEVIPQEVLVEWAIQDVNITHPNYGSLLASWNCDGEMETTFTDSGPLANNGILSEPLEWVDQDELFVITDFADSPKEEDNALTVLSWFCVPIDPAWNLDGHSLLEDCETSVANLDDAGISVYPNPTTGTITLQAKDKIEEVSVYDASGALCMIHYKPTQIDLNCLDSGIYFIMARSGDRSCSSQVVVQH